MLKNKKKYKTNFYFYKNIRYSFTDKLFNKPLLFYKLLEYRKGFFSYYPWYEKKNFNLNKLNKFIIKKYFNKKYDYNKLYFKINNIYLFNLKKKWMKRFKIISKYVK